MNHWIIEDRDLIAELWVNGYECREGHHPWYETDLPIEFNGTLTLKSGLEVRSHGTRLTIVGSELDQRLTQEEREVLAAWEREHRREHRSAS